MAGKKKSRRRCSAVGHDKQVSLLVLVKSVGEGFNICLVAAQGRAQQICLDVKGKIYIFLHEVLGDFRLSSGKYSFLIHAMVRADLTCLFHRPSSEYNK